MQLTNICRDVGEDARGGRIYLPLLWLRQEGVDVDAFMSEPTFSVELGRVIERVLVVADGLYYRAHAGIQHLPYECHLAIQAASSIYHQIGEQVGRSGVNCNIYHICCSVESTAATRLALSTEFLYFQVKRAGFDSVSQRHYVSRPKKLLIATSCAVDVYMLAPLNRWFYSTFMWHAHCKICQCGCQGAELMMLPALRANQRLVDDCSLDHNGDRIPSEELVSSMRPSQNRKSYNLVGIGVVLAVGFVISCKWGTLRK